LSLRISEQLNSRPPSGGLSFCAKLELHLMRKTAIDLIAATIAAMMI